MLRELHIKNLILIDEMYIEFTSGLNILTGETGAGKTALIEAVNLLLGERGDSTMIRSGRNEAEVQGLFAVAPSRLENQSGLKGLIGEDDELIVIRKISKEGKSRSYVNGNLVNLSVLKELGNLLIDIHGQHDHQSLLRIQSHLGFLDQYGGLELLDLRSDFTRASGELKAEIELVKKLSDSSLERAKEQELLRFQIDEIKGATLKEGEEEALLQEAQLLRNSERVMEALLKAKSTISSDNEGSVLERLKLSNLSLAKVSSLEPRLAQASERLEGVAFELEDLAAELRSLSEEFAHNPTRLGEVEDRLAAISALKKKYGRSIKEIIDFSLTAQEKLGKIDDSDERLTALKESIDSKSKTLYSLGLELSKKRREAAERFEAEVIGHLRELNMAKIRFKVAIETLGQDNLLLLSSGVDRVEFLISPNPGEILRPLAKIASGGEISRVMLALKIALAKVDEIETLIFDEIDSGVGAVTAGYVGEKLSLLSKSHQIISVTHLPQIAAYGDLHYRVFKEEEAGTTKTRVDNLSFDDRIDEIARMLGGKGSPTDLSKEHARELLDLAKG